MTDLVLPDRVSRRVPVVSGTVLVAGLILNLRAWRKADREARGKGPGPRDG